MSARADRRGGARIAIAVAAIASISACAKSQETSAPGDAPFVDDIARIDAQLSANAEMLESEGVVIVQAQAKQAEEAENVEDVETEESADGPALAGSVDAADGAPARDAPQHEKKAKAKRGATRCERVCDLAESTCDLRARICDLARVHDGDPRYENACERATSQCRAARDACARCR